MCGRMLPAIHITRFIFIKSESTVAIWPEAGQDAKNKILLSEKVGGLEGKQPFGQQAGHDDGKDKSL